MEGITGVVRGLRSLFLFGVSVDFIKHIRVRQERAEAGFGAEIDRPAALLHAGKIGRVGIAEDPSTEGDEARKFFARGW
jgi:hypothetical protein